jgi:hypothetical protein
MNTMSLNYAIPTIPLVIHVAIQAFGTVRLRAATKKIGGVIRSRSDLDQVRNAIQTNLFLGVPIVCNGLLLAAAIFWASAVSSAFMRLFYIALLAVIQIVMWKISRPVEKRFKALPVESQDAELVAEYRDYVEQWGGAHLFLKSSRSGAAAPKNISRIY